METRVVVRLVLLMLVVGALGGSVATILLFDREVDTITLTTPAGEYSIHLSTDGRIEQSALLDRISESDFGRTEMNVWLAEKQSPVTDDALANIRNPEQWLPPGGTLDNEAVMRLRGLVEQLEQPFQLPAR